MGSHNSRSNSAGSRSSHSLSKVPNDTATIRKMEQFPLVLSDATMPDDADLSLKFLALVRVYLYAGCSINFVIIIAFVLHRKLKMIFWDVIAECSRSDRAGERCVAEESIKVLVSIVGPSGWFRARWSWHCLEKENRRC